MATMIQIRNVPDEIHRSLKAKAALEGLTLSDFLLREVREIALRPTPAELMARLATRAPVKTRETMAQAVRRERDSR
jgi:plasmid stability protein